MERVREKYGLSERQACRIVGQPRGTQRYTVIVRADEDALTQAIMALAAQYGRYGYRRITKPNHSWANGQVERMNRTLKEATVNRYHYGTHAQLKEHVQAFLMAYNFAKRLKTLRGLTPYEHMCKVWTKQPKRFRLNPLHRTLGLNT